MPEPLEFRLVDTFAHAPYTGNVAGVVLSADGLTDRQMLAIASEFNASETAFILQPTTRDAAIRIRWFTPGCEVNFCGHATIGSVHALLESGRFTRGFAEPGTILPIETRSGILTVRVEKSPKPEFANTIWLDMPHCEPSHKPANAQTVCRRMGLDPDALDPTFPPFRTCDEDVMLAVKDLQTLLTLEPTMAELNRYCRGEGIRGVFVTCRQALSGVTAVQSRFFAPAAGVDEDPVTGSAHGPLGLHLVRSGIVPLHNGRADFLCAQGKAGGRAGIVRVVVVMENGDTPKVRVGGTCHTAAIGTLAVLPER